MAPEVGCATGESEELFESLSRDNLRGLPLGSRSGEDRSVEVRVKDGILKCGGSGKDRVWDAS